ncbi:MAG: MFS transporter [Acidobacteriota bacterium]|nr:MFS transporter [Acidobacteriota bacterium]
MAQGLGETYLSALMVWLGAGSLVLGLVGALPTAATAFSQVVAARILAGASGARAFIRRTWLLQALALAVVGSFALLPGRWAVPLVLAGATSAWFLGGLSVPAWTSLVARTVPRPRYGWFFGLRGAAQQIGIVAAILGGGLLLASAEAAGALALGFVLVFGLAGMSRAVGSGLLLEVPERVQSRRGPPVRALLRELGTSVKFRRLATYLWAIHFATWVAVPFFLPYMLRDLEFGYRQVGVLIAVPAVVKALTMRVWGRVADRIGPGPLLRTVGWCVLPVSALWLVSGQFWWIAFAQVYAGLAWGAFELAQASALLQTTRGRESTIALFNLVDGGAMITGSVIGGLIVMGAERVTGAGFLMAIAVSTGLRGLTAVLLLRRVRRIGKPRWSHLSMPLRLWGIRAARGPTFRPWSSLPPAAE